MFSLNKKGISCFKVGYLLEPERLFPSFQSEISEQLHIYRTDAREISITDQCSQIHI